MATILKTASLAFLVLVLSAVVSAQLLMRTTSHIPERPLVTLAYYFAWLTLGGSLLASLTLISKVHRNWLSFLKVLAFLLALAFMSNCSGLMSKTQEKLKPLTGTAGITVVTPSDWAVVEPSVGEGIDFMVANWDGSGSILFTLGKPADAPVANADVAAESARVADLLASQWGRPTNSFACGSLCLGKQFETTTDGKPIRALLALKYAEGRWLVMTGAAARGRAEHLTPMLITIMESVELHPKKPQATPTAPESGDRSP